MEKSCKKNKQTKESVTNKMPSFLLISCILFFFLLFLLEVSILVHGAEKASIPSLEQNDTKLLPSCVAVTCVVY